jgi:transcription initiation factor TFIIIB Brf1 subunit/transcription initiation factor TFIIB
VIWSAVPVVWSLVIVSSILVLSGVPSPTTIKAMMIHLVLVMAQTRFSTVLNFTTTIAFGDGSASSRDLLRAQGKSSTDKATKGLLAAYKEIGAHCDAVNIPKNVSDTAKHLFKLVDDAKAFKGKSQEAIIAGCIFIACRQCGVPRTFREIYALTKVSKKDIGRTFKALEKFFAQDSAGKVAMASATGKLRVNVLIILLRINILS